MKILGIDLEIGNPFNNVNGEDWPKDQTWLTEIGMIMYDTDFGCQPVKSFECLINEEKGVSEDAEEYTGISSALIETHGRSPGEFTSKIMSWFHEADYVVAHNGTRADKPWLKAFLQRYTGAGAFDNWSPPIWLDSLIDIEYPNNCKQKNLTYLAGFHGFCNPFPHRAGSDVMTMMKIFFNYNVDRIIAVNASPKVIYKALAPIDIDPTKKKKAFTSGTDEYIEMELWKKKVKRAGFGWDGQAENTGQKCWFKISRQIWVDEGRDKFNFETIVVQTA